MDKNDPSSPTLDRLQAVRSAGSVVAGYLVFGALAVLLFALSGREPHAPMGGGFLVVSTLYGMLAATAGGYVAARLGGRRPVLHGVMVAAIIAAGALASMASLPDDASPASQIAALVLMAPSAVLGGYLRRRLEAQPR